MERYTKTDDSLADFTNFISTVKTFVKNYKIKRNNDFTICVGDDITEVERLILALKKVQHKNMYFLPVKVNINGETFPVSEVNIEQRNGEKSVEIVVKKE